MARQMASEGFVNNVVSGGTSFHGVYSADLSTLETKVLLAHSGTWFNIWGWDAYTGISNTMTIYGDFLEPRNRDLDLKIKLD